MRNRRIALNAKASVSLLMGCVALSSMLPTAASQAAVPHAVAGLAALAAAGQLGGSSGASKASEDLLRVARAAIKRGDYAKAETLITSAEKLGVKYNALTARMYDTPDKLRSSARRGSDPTWKIQDPQLPKSIWYLTDAQFLGFRVVRPLRVPLAEECSKYWTSGVEKD